ncbi:FHA domain-containing protein [archaeon]|jgi:pSer/pThr/pTyr-binding forkhead associated (FHA) protein|nr:FHA domain-containing protein [archaeon]
MKVILEEIEMMGFVEDEPLFFEIDSDIREYVLGRSKKCNGVINYCAVSRIHCGIYPRGISGNGSPAIIDFRSSNGTSINRELVGHSSEFYVNDGDELTLGSRVKFKISIK